MKVFQLNEVGKGFILVENEDKNADCKVTLEFDNQSNLSVEKVQTFE